MRMPMDNPMFPNSRFSATAQPRAGSSCSAAAPSSSPDPAGRNGAEHPHRIAGSRTANLRQSGTLDPGRKSPEVIRLEDALRARVVGQDDAIAQIIAHYQTYLAGLTPEGRPICNLLLLGPTGCGKTRTVEALAEALAGDRHALIKVDCGEFQHSHEIAKLIGSPPGYLGHRETHPRLCQEKLDLYHTDNMKLSFVLFDEIEKASDALWNLLLGILDKGVLTLGDNRLVDFSQTMVFMTGNLGTAEAQRLRDLPWGFAAPAPTAGQQRSAESAASPDGVPRKGHHPPLASLSSPPSAGSHAPSQSADDAAFPLPVEDTTSLPQSARFAGSTVPAAPTSDWRGSIEAARPASRQKGTPLLPAEGALPQPNSPVQIHPDTALASKVEKAVLEAAKRKFSPEFLNRLDRVILCHPLDRNQITSVLDLEIQEIVTRIDRRRQCGLQLLVSDAARDFLVSEGYDPNCGARYLKRAIERRLVQPLSSLLATRQVADGDELLIDLSEDATQLEFRRGVQITTGVALRQLAAQWNGSASGSPGSR